jgi:toxin ParE1/3/4
MSYTVLLTAGAERDLEAIYEHIVATDGPGRADHVLQQLLDISSKLASSPERGAYPKELLALGIREYRQVYFKPYRVIYRIMGQRVFIMLIVDGRRNLQLLLERRLLGSGF